MGTRMTRKMLALASVLALAGCGGGGLEVSGNVDIATMGGTMDATTGFAFPDPVRLDGGAGLITGSCVMTRGATGSYGIVVDLFSSDTNPQGRAIRSMTIMTRSDESTGSISAQLGQDDFDNGSCQMHVTGIDGSSGQVAFASTGDCLLQGPGGETATVDFELGLTRCGVQ
jgi:hypothetical protein